MVIHPQKVQNFPKVPCGGLFPVAGKRIPEAASFYDIAPPEARRMK